MNSKTIILIGGCLAAGKSAFSKRLSQKLGVLCINKDYVKEILCDTLGFSSRTENKRFSETTFHIMRHVAEQSMKSGLPIILESNFRPADGEKLLPLIQKYGYIPITIMLTGNLQVLFQRYTKRLENRHPAHKSGAFRNFESYAAHCQLLLGFDVGSKKITVDTTNFDNIDFDGILLQMKGWFNEKYT